MIPMSTGQKADLHFYKSDMHDIVLLRRYMVVIGQAKWIYHDLSPFLNVVTLSALVCV